MNFLNNLPPITKNIIIINLIMYGATVLFEGLGYNFTSMMGLHFYLSDDFKPYQLLTHMFMHGGIYHIFFNMYALYIFGPILENRIGPKKYFIFYLLTGFGAVILHFASLYWEEYELITAVKNIRANYSVDGVIQLVNQNISNVANPENYNNIVNEYNSILSSSKVNGQQVDIITSNLIDGTLSIVVGASGALFGVLAGFAMLYPNQRLYLLFIPYPLKAKYLVIGYAALELYLGFSNSNDHIAHFAHLGGALFGVLIIREWRRKFII